MLFAYERPLCAGGNRTFPQGQFLTLTDIDCRSATQATWFRARLACWRRRPKSLSLAESESRFVTASGSISLFGKEMEKTRGHCYVERPEKDRFSFRRRATRGRARTTPSANPLFPAPP